MNNQYYAIATDNKGQSRIINNGEGKPFTSRIEASIESERLAKRNEWTIDGIYVVVNRNNEGRVLTKFARHRRQNNGQNPKAYYEAL